MEILPVISRIVQLIIGFIGLLGALAVVTSTIEYNQSKGKDKAKAEEARTHITRAFGIVIVSLLLYLLFSTVGPIFRFIF